MIAQNHIGGFYRDFGFEILRGVNNFRS